MNGFLNEISVKFESLISRALLYPLLKHKQASERFAMVSMGTDQHEFMFESFWHTLLPCRLVIFAAAPAHGSVITFVKRLILVTSV